MVRRRIVAAKDTEWSIGIYGGASPYDLAPLKDVSYPVLTARDVTDIKAEFVADPFMIRHTSKWYMFFEVLNALTDRGEIGLATSDDGVRWRYERIVLREPFHLSYPYVFRYRDDFYMVPESVTEDSITLYVAVAFPYQWKPVGAMISGTFADPSVVRYQGRWWLFACSEPYAHDVLHLYHADELFGPWKEHPRSPIVDGDTVAGRCGGRILDQGDHLIRFAQDCSERYGKAVNAFKVMKITESDYEEQRVTPKPIVKDAGQLARGSRWNRHGMHHIDAIQVDGGSWLACVDGYRKFLSVRMEY
jgi:beta-xylosidase